MSMIPKKSPSDSDRAIADLTSRIGEMTAREKELLERQITIETTTGASKSEVGADAAQTEALLNGTPFVASRDRPMSQLSEIVAERAALARALKIGAERLSRLTTERAERIWATHFAEIAEIEKRHVMLVFELQRTNRAREKLREKITKAGGAGFLSTDGVEFLGFGDEYAEIQWAANRLISDGVATRAEIEKARSDG
jgi:hypothetical protein